MTKEEFVSKVVDKGWMWAEKDGKFYVRLKNDRTVETKDKFSEGLIRHIGSYDVIHMTRIVGYYSRVNNWNKSKIGELADRQKGDYDGTAIFTAR